ncbi:hypothetical protein MYOV003v1_p0108 [Vibrio phage 207E48.1]|nr:hypothetical protein MYOV003v1_p0108 [Vibrio phage 207E48.1]
MLKKQGFVMPDKWQYPIDPTVDYRLSENRHHLMMAWAEAMFHTGELNQQLRLMDHALPIQDELPEEGTEYYALIEEKLWLAFLWGCCYNGIGPWVIMSAFPTPPRTDNDFDNFTNWYNENFERIRFDTDCRYRKSKMLACVKSYVDWLGDRTQKEAIIDDIIGNCPVRTPMGKYDTLKETADSWKYYGRLSTWNYIEAVALVTGWRYDLDCQDFLLTDVTGSESNRNGVSFIMERDDLVTKHGKKKESGEKITHEECLLVGVRGEELFQELVENLGHIDPVLRVNVETIFCWMKKRFRARNTRYIGWDEGRTYDEFKFIEDNWGDEVDCSLIWEARKAWLPEFMLSENYPEGVERGSSNTKMGVFWSTGTPTDLVLFQQGLPWHTTGEIAKAPKSVKTRKLW